MLPEPAEEQKSAPASSHSLSRIRIWDSTPCCPTNSEKADQPSRVTGVSTADRNTTRRVSDSTGSVGQITNAQTPEAVHLGYQVSTIRIRNIRLRPPAAGWTRWIGSTWSTSIKLKALATAS